MVRRGVDRKLHGVSCRFNGSRVAVGVLKDPQRAVYLLRCWLAWCFSFFCLPRLGAGARGGGEVGRTYERALIFLLLRLSRRTLFFLHLALILNDAVDAG